VVLNCPWKPYNLQVAPHEVSGQSYAESHGISQAQPQDAIQPRDPDHGSALPNVPDVER